MSLRFLTKISGISCFVAFVMTTSRERLCEENKGNPSFSNFQTIANSNCTVLGQSNSKLDIYNTERSEVDETKL